MAMQEREEDGFGTGAGDAVRRVGSVSNRRTVEKRTRSRLTGGLRLRFSRGVLPRTVRGRVIGSVVVFACLSMLAGAGFEGQHYLLHDDRFVIPASSSIQIQGNSHLTRAQLLSVFGEDVDRNIFTVSLAKRREELERLPWVEHATVMRLLPDRLRVSIVERDPVAFVRQGSKIGLVDKNGVLLDMDDDADSPDSPAARETQYSFPVVTGVSEDDPESVRAARMKIYLKFTHDLDSSKENISSKLSEVDLSNPEDVKALIPDQANGGANEILVHFGDTNFLDRYRKFEEQMPQWHAQYPKLASADMRYERQVVLEMQPGVVVPVSSTDDAGVEAPGVKPPASKKAAAVKKPTVVATKPHPVPAKTLSAFGQPHFPGDAPMPPKHTVSSRPAKP